MEKVRAVLFDMDGLMEDWRWFVSEFTPYGGK